MLYIYACVIIQKKFRGSQSQTWNLYGYVRYVGENLTFYWLSVYVTKEGKQQCCCFVYWKPFMPICKTNLPVCCRVHVRDCLIHTIVHTLLDSRIVVIWRLTAASACTNDHSKTCVFSILCECPFVCTGLLLVCIMHPNGYQGIKLHSLRFDFRVCVGDVWFWKFSNLHCSAQFPPLSKLYLKF